MCFRSQGSVCLLSVCLAACIACYSPHALGEGPPIQATQQHEWEVRIQAALDATDEWDFKDFPLRDVCELIQEKLDIDVAIDTRALEDFGIDSDTPITRSISGISNRSFLRLMLNELELTFTMRYGALWITTPEEAEARLTTKVYPVGRLLVRDSSLPERLADDDFLIGAIMASIAPDTWDEVGGPGSIDGIHDTLVISQTYDVHEEVERFLTTYSEIITGDNAEQQQTVFMLGQEQSTAAHAALDKPLTAEFKDVTLKEFLEFLIEKMDIPIVLDTRALDDFGIDPSIPINGSFTNTPLRFALARILREQELTYMIRDEVLFITTPEECERALDIGLYPVRDLVQITEALPIDPPGTNCDFDSLIKVITSTIVPDTWDEVGGPGAIGPLLPAPTLMISQTQDVHREIAELITKLRATRKQEAARTAANENVEPGALLVRSYPLHANYFAPDEVAKLVIRASEPGTWDADPGTFVQGLGASIVVRHNVSGHRQVQKLLLRLGVWNPSRGGARTNKQMLGGGFGDGSEPPGGSVGQGGFF